jgi:hypothetical protein
MALSTQNKICRDFLLIDVRLSVLSVLGVAQSTLENPEGLMNYTVFN